MLKRLIAMLALAGGLMTHAYGQTYPGQLPAFALASVPITPDSFCTVDRTGASDMGTCINNTIAAAAPSCASGASATLKLRGGTYLITTPIVPKSCLNIVGDGRGRTILLTNSNAPFAQASLTQLVHFTLEGVTFKDSGSHASATAMTFGAGFQGNVIRNIGFHGYTTGAAMNLTANGTVTTFSDTSGIYNSSNSFFNTFEDWVEDDSMATGLIIAGNLSTPCNVSTATNVVTDNIFKDIQFWGVTAVGWDLVRAADSNTFIGGNIIRLIGSGAAVNTPHASFKNIAVQLGDDNATCATNNDVALERMQLTVTMASPATSFIMFNAGNNTFGHIIDFQTDQATSINAGFTAMAGVTGINYTINGRNYTTTLDDGAGNLFELELSQAKYYRFMDGTAALPAIGWAADLANGFFRPGSGVMGLSKGIAFQFNGSASGSLNLTPNSTATLLTFSQPIASGANGGASGSFQALGSTSGSWTASASATGVPTMSTPWPVAAGGTGDTGTAWTAFTPSFTCTSGTWSVNSARSKTLGKTTWIEIDATLGAAACTGATTFTLPVAANSTGSVNGQETVNTNAAVACRFIGATATATCVANGGSNFAGNSRIVASGVYENQ